MKSSRRPAHLINALFMMKTGLTTILSLFLAFLSNAAAQMPNSDTEVNLRPFVHVFTVQTCCSTIVLSLPSVTSLRQGKFDHVVEVRQKEEPSLTSQLLQTATSGESPGKPSAGKRYHFEVKYIRVDRTSDLPLIFLGAKLKSDECLQKNSTSAAGYTTGALNTAQNSVPFAEMIRTRTAEEIADLLQTTGTTDLMEAFEKMVLQQNQEDNNSHATLQDSFDHRLDRTNIVGMDYECVDLLFDSIFRAWTGTTPDRVHKFGTTSGPEYFGPGSNP